MGMSCKNTINKEKDADPKLSREKTFIFAVSEQSMKTSL